MWNTAKCSVSCLERSDLFNACANASKIILLSRKCESFFGFFGGDQLCSLWFMGWRKVITCLCRASTVGKSLELNAKSPRGSLQVRQVDSAIREAMLRHRNASLDANHQWQRRAPTPPTQVSGPGVSQEGPLLDWNGNLRKQRFREGERKMSGPDSASLSACCLLPYRCHFLLALSCNYWWQIITFGAFWLWGFRM